MKQPLAGLLNGGSWLVGSTKIPPVRNVLANTPQVAAPDPFSQRTKLSMSSKPRTLALIILITNPC